MKVQMYGFNTNLSPRYPEDSHNANMWKVDGMTVDEWIEYMHKNHPDVKATYQMFWDLRDQTINQYSFAVFGNLKEANGVSVAENFKGKILDFPLDAVLDTVGINNDESALQVLDSIGSWGKVKDIINGTVKGDIYGYDIETFGDVVQGKEIFGITELGLGKRTYPNGTGRIAQGDGAAIFTPLHSEQLSYLDNVLQKLKDKGWDSLTNSEKVSLQRSSKYRNAIIKADSGIAKTLFGSIGEGKTYYTVDNLVEDSLAIEDIKQGINQLREYSIGQHGPTINGVADTKTVLTDFLQFLKQSEDLKSNDFHRIFYGANSTKFDIPVIKKLLKVYGIEDNDGTYSRLLDNLRKETLDVVNLPRAIAALHGESVNSFLRNFYGHSTGASVQSQRESFLMLGDQEHHSLKDIKNEAELYEKHLREFFGSFLTPEELGEQIEGKVETRTIEDFLDNSLIHIRSGQLDKTQGKQIGIVPLYDINGNVHGVMPTQNYPISGQFWAVDRPHTGIGTTSDGGRIYTLGLVNYGDKITLGDEQANRVLIVDDNLEGLYKQVEGLINPNNVDIMDLVEDEAEKTIWQEKGAIKITRSYANEVSGKPNVFRVHDAARREYSKYFSAREIRQDGASTAFGYTNLQKVVEWNQTLHDYVEKKGLTGIFSTDGNIGHDSVTKLQQILLDKEVLKSSPELQRVGIRASSRYEIGAFLALDNVIQQGKSLYTDIDQTLNINGNISTAQEIDKTIMASKMRDAVMQEINDRFDIVSNLIQQHRHL